MKIGDAIAVLFQVSIATMGFTAGMITNNFWAAIIAVASLSWVVTYMGLKLYKEEEENENRNQRR